MLDTAEIDAYVASLRALPIGLDGLIGGLVHEGASEEAIRAALRNLFFKGLEKGGFQLAFNNLLNLPGVKELAVAYKKEKRRSVSFFNSQIALIPGNLAKNVQSTAKKEILKARNLCLKALLISWLIPLFKCTQHSSPTSTEDKIFTTYFSDNKSLKQVESYLLDNEVKAGQQGIFAECIYVLVKELIRVGKSEYASYDIVKQILSLSCGCDLSTDAIRLQYKRFSLTIEAYPSPSLQA